MLASEAFSDPLSMRNRAASSPDQGIRLAAVQGDRRRNQVDKPLPTLLLSRATSANDTPNAPMLSELRNQVHEAASRRLFLPLYRLQRFLIPSRRAQLRAFYAGSRFRSATAEWDDQRKREWILARLRFCVRRAFDTTGYYRNLFTGMGFDPHADFSFDDFARLPVLERGDIHAAGRELISSAVLPGELRKDATGGSTGTPTELWLGPEERGWKESASEHFMRRIGVPQGSRKALLWGHHLDPVASDRFADRLRDFVQHQEWFDCLRLSPEVLTRYHARMQEMQPRCVVAYATALGALAKRVRELGGEPSYPKRCFVTGAEKLLPQHRQVIEEVFGRPVHERYGSRDVGLIGFQLDVQETLDFTIDWANVLIEPEVADGVSSILVTKLHADGMPMFRYRIGDLGRFPDGSRPGHPAFVLHEVLGRELDGVWLPDGRWMHGVGFPHLMKDFPLREFQVIQNEDYSVLIDLVPAAGFDEAAHKQIVASLAPNLPGVPLSTRLVDRVERTTANKWRPVITKVKQRNERSS